MDANLDEETLLDTVGTVSVAIGIGVVVFIIVNAGPKNVDAALQLLQSATELMILGLLAIVGGGAVKAYVGFK